MDLGSDRMASHRSPAGALCLFSALGLAAVAAAMVLLLAIQRRVIHVQRERERSTMVQRTRERCDTFKEMLLARLEAVVDQRAGVASLGELREELGVELHRFQSLHEAGQGFHALLVDRELQPIASFDPDDEGRMYPCAAHLRGLEERVYTKMHEGAGERGMPAFLCYACPIQRGGKLLGGLMIHKELDPVGDAFAAVNRQMTWTVVATQLVLLAALAAVAWSGRRAIAEAERCRAEDERLVALGNLAAGIAHEIRNPLNTIGLTCRYLERFIGEHCERSEARAEFNRNFEIVASEVARLTRTLDNFLLLARPADVELTERDVDDMVDAALALYAQELDEAGVQVERHRASGLAVLADADRLEQVFVNLIRNAAQAMDGGTLTVTSSRADGRVRVAFADTGPGIGAGALHHLFEPYYSTKRSGLGLGLALSQKIVAAHHGTIDVANQAGGAVFTVVLPAHEPAAAEGAHV